MSKRARKKSAPPSLQRRIINRLIIPVAIIEPLGTIPQIIAVFWRHDASGLSLSSWLIYVFFDILWIWYGITERQRAVIISGVLFALTEGLVVIGALMYGGKW
jgi:MtN3 and saliva related transmembrane protein